MTSRHIFRTKMTFWPLMRTSFRNPHMVIASHSVSVFLTCFQKRTRRMTRIPSVVFPIHRVTWLGGGHYGHFAVPSNIYQGRKLRNFYRQIPASKSKTTKDEKMTYNQIQGESSFSFNPFIPFIYRNRTLQILPSLFLYHHQSLLNPWVALKRSAPWYTKFSSL